ncbi:methyl-accepting chemotaxis protein [Aquabacter sp. CN5-332]|uniref:methyl-accepting chemotaxis protein n=1 Tax=Aquabacter sp. CN5-332 TaxID=3156608 RepID=UPI0032B4BA3B
MWRKLFDPRHGGGPAIVDTKQAPLDTISAAPLSGERERVIDDEVVDLIEADIRGAQARTAKTAGEMASACAAGVRDIATIRRNCDQLTQQTDQARGSARHLSEALTAFAQTNEEIDRQAKTSDQLAHRAGSAASEANAAIGELRTAITEIRAVVSLISQIANQTNMLALNASIEAARAGTVGAGFAVVASEVKTLAAQTRQATGEISDKIDRLMRVSDASTDAVNSVIGAVDEIKPVAFAVAEAVAGQTRTIAEIGRSATEAMAFADAVDHGARAIQDATVTAEATQVTIEASGTALGSGTDEMSRQLLTVLRQTPMGNRRRHPRWPVEISGRLNGATSSVAAKTSDLSLGGALVKLSDAKLRVGEACTLELSGLAPLRCRIVAISQLGYHLAFQEAGAPALKARIDSIAKTYEAVIERAVRGAAAIAQSLEAGLKEGAFSMADLFDRAYRPIPDSDPVQFETRALAKLEQRLPAIQEAIVKEDPQLMFAAAVDVNGYLPVHNAQYAHPQRPGERAWNTANCRNKRIFDDRAGLLAARNLEPHLIQVYARDLGDKVMFMREVDAPIHVAGRHWGGFRSAYKL